MLMKYFKLPTKWDFLEGRIFETTALMANMTPRTLSDKKQLQLTSHTLA